MNNLTIFQFKSQAERFKKWITSVVIPSIRKTGTYAIPTAVKGATIAQPTTEPQPQLLPTPTEISEVIDLILGQTGLDLKLVAEALLPREFVPNWTYSNMTPNQVQILLRVDRELALQRFLSDYFLPCLEERGYNLRNLLQALGSVAFDNNEKVAHQLWDAVASLDNTTTPSRHSEPI